MVEQRVHLTFTCTGSGQFYYCTYAFVVVKYFDNKKLTVQHTKLLNTRDIRPNHHMKKYRTEIS